MNAETGGEFADIADHALIGDCHGAALVSKCGRIDWAALDRFDADPVFFKLLDTDIGGHFSISPDEATTVTRRYKPGTNILETVFETSTSKVVLTDCMPVGRQLGAGAHDYVSLRAPGWIIRRLQGVRGAIAFTVRYRLSDGFDKPASALSADEQCVRAGEKRPALFSDLQFRIIDGTDAKAHVSVEKDDQYDLVFARSWLEGESPCARVDQMLDVTTAFWTEWLAYCRYAGPHSKAVQRSALVLKCLTYAPTGAIVAAPTTSLPEAMGGERNWDYRFSWVRDAAFTVFALAVLGYSGEAQRYVNFLEATCARSLPVIRPMYGIDGRLDLDEVTFEQLRGFRDSVPVRQGNDAYRQRQIDVFGQLLDLAWLYQSLGGQLSEAFTRLLKVIAAYIEQHWDEPGPGLWEMRGEQHHHIHDKLMCWVGMDRAAALFGERWQPVAERIRRSIVDNGGIADEQCLRQHYNGGRDAATLLAPMLGFPLERQVLSNTIDTVRAKLGRGRFLARYDADDGLAGEEGAFVLCSSWLIDAELSIGRIEDAKAHFDELLHCVNDVGLLAEEIDPESGAFLGNFPQAFSHLGLIGNAVNLEIVNRRSHAALQGSYGDRAKRTIRASFGLRGWLAGITHDVRRWRIRTSRSSMMPWP